MVEPLFFPMMVPIIRRRAIKKSMLLSERNCLFAFSANEKVDAAIIAPEAIRDRVVQHNIMVVAMKPLRRFGRLTPLQYDLCSWAGPDHDLLRSSDSDGTNR